MKTSVSWIVGLWLYSALVQSAVVTFDQISIPGGSEYLTTYIEDGVKVKGSFVHTHGGLEGNPYNETPFVQYQPWAFFNVRMVDGSLFNMRSIDLAELNMEQAGPTTVTFIGLRPGSDDVSVSFTIDGLISGSAGDFQTFYFGEAFSGLSYVYIADAPKDMIRTYSIDNIHVSAVPVPAAAWLFLSGLVAMFKLSRRHRIS
ncbi:MAG: hypothetical protein EP315_03485 [Gammaproteobacteria bacterium]|nr:MAG: hypothetical protein EP315_03485 [Gammaproteobacteria bacterium]